MRQRVAEGVKAVKTATTNLAHPGLKQLTSQYNIHPLRLNGERPAASASA